MHYFVFYENLLVQLVDIVFENGIIYNLIFTQVGLIMSFEKHINDLLDNILCDC